MGERYLVWSNEHQAWWRANRCGYTMHLEAAGRYTHNEALEICRKAHHGWPDGGVPAEIPVLEDDAIGCIFPPRPANGDENE